MPTLNWIGRKAVENHHRQVPFHLLKDEPALSVGDPGTGNLLVEGDNLLALKALLPYYAGQVKCIYIDPPYNTGNEGWVYNDNVNSPEMREWLGKTVGREAEDLCRHDKWLCMMYPRLQLLWSFLNSDGSIWISMDDSEISNLRFLTDEIFGRDKFIASNIWQKRYSRENREAIGDVHEYVLVYAKDPERFKATRHRVPIDAAQAKVYKNPNNDPNGRWRGIPMTAQGWRPNQMYEVVTPAGVKHKPPEGRCWSTIEGEFKRLLAEGRIYFGKHGKSQPNIIRYLAEVEGFVPWTWWPHEEVGHTDESKKEIQSILGTQTAFDTPKPVRLIQRVLQIATNPGDIVLDSFAGSGTTGHAVLKMNRENVEAAPRRFILIEMDSNICRNVTAERLRRVCNGYAKPSADAIEGLGGGFRFATLGEPLFDEHGNIRKTVRFGDLARHVYFTETGEPLPVDATPSSRNSKESGGGAASTTSANAAPASCSSQSGGGAASTAVLNYFDPQAPIGHVRGGNLPHWRQEGVVYFVTWRTADSMPAERVNQWFKEREDWLARHPEPHSLADDAEYDRLFSARWEQWLDECHGECPLAQPRLHEIVTASLRHFDGVQYRLHEFAVMPNHVHVLASPLGEYTLSAIVQAWKSATAHAINKVLSRKGEFWQKESFDHIVRNAKEMERIRAYILGQATVVDATPSSRASQSGEGAASTPLIGVCRGTAVYLLYNGILKDKSTDGGNVLTTGILAHLPRHDGPKVVYGTACRLGVERLRHEGIVFKQLPYKLKVDAR